MNEDIFVILRNKEREINAVRNVFLPAEYYYQKLEKLGEGSIPDIFITNCITRLNGRCFSTEDQEKLRNLIKRKKLIPFDIDNDKRIDFDSKIPDTDEKIEEKILKAYYNGQIIPIELAKKIISGCYSETMKTNKIILQACMQSIISTTLLKKGVDIHGQVLFGYGNDYSGVYSGEKWGIWLDYKLLENFLSEEVEKYDKSKIISISQHEMKHAIQYDNIKKGKIDFQTFMFLIEDVIMEYDEDFYNENYETTFIEADARKEQSVAPLEFLSEMNLEFVDEIGDLYNEEHMEEVMQFPIYKTEMKKIGSGYENINVMVYLGILISYYPEILEKNPILQIYYNIDGSTKNILKLLEEFEQKKEKINDSEEYERIYSIYYGLISRMKNWPIEKNMKSELKNKLEKFESEIHTIKLITPEYMQTCYEDIINKDPGLLNKVFERIKNVFLREDKREEEMSSEEQEQ